MRHTHASLLIASGSDIKTASARLGNASTSFILDPYGYLMPGNRIAVEKFDQAVMAELVREQEGYTGKAPSGVLG